MLSQDQGLNLDIPNQNVVTIQKHSLVGPQCHRNRGEGNPSELGTLHASSKWLTASKLIDLATSVANAERDQDDCSFYVVLSPREGQHFSQPTRLEIIMNHEEGYLEKHRSADAYKKFQE